MPSDDTPPTRERLLTAAMSLFHQHGYAAVSLQRIAESVGLKQGNVYYHFRTKRDLGVASLARWAEINRTGLGSLETAKSPQRQILRYLDWSEEQETAYLAHGCPIAKLTAELLSESDGQSRNDVPGVHAETLDWLGVRFSKLGQSTSRSARSAKFLLASAQGAIHVGHATGNPRVFAAVRSELASWLAGVAG